MAAIKDLVLVHIDNKPGFYARIEDISPDMKPGWWQVKLLVLAFPLQIFTWTLDENQIDGEPYTMGGTPVRRRWSRRWKGSINPLLKRP
jgi:hypothetical protein